jgi:hypothetical protein
MPDHPTEDPNTFAVDSHFQKMARRAGGIPREQALENARIALDAIKLGFRDWLDGEIGILTAEIQKGRAAPGGDLGWADTAAIHCRQIRDVGSTMGFELVTFIANNLCGIFESIAAGGIARNDMIDCHIDALYLAKQEQYRHLRPEQLPELSIGLRRVLEVAGTPSTGGDK